MAEAEAHPASVRTELVIVTGMSGAGRTTTANVLEDLGWYVVDNLPPHLLLPLTELASQRSGSGELPRIAAVIDVRGRGFFTDLPRGAGRRCASGAGTPTVVFLDATDEALVRRFESVRRPHPLQGEGRILDGIVRERDLLRRPAGGRGRRHRHLGAQRPPARRPRWRRIFSRGRPQGCASR